MFQNDENDRRKIWEKSMKFVTKHNLEHSIGKHTFTVGMNQFGDMVCTEPPEVELAGDNRPFGPSGLCQHS